MEKAYAQALWQLIARGIKPLDAVHALKAQLKVSGREKLLPKIATAFEHLALRKGAADTITLFVSDQAHEHAAKKEAAQALVQLNLTEKETAIRFDSTLIGGWRLETGEELLDASYKHHLLSLYRAITHTA